MAESPPPVHCTRNRAAMTQAASTDEREIRRLLITGKIAMVVSPFRSSAGTVVKNYGGSMIAPDGLTAGVS
jgi:hypothetical protein